MENRFDRNGECKCVHIANGKCHQTSICDVCKLYKEPQSTGSIPLWWHRQADNSMCSKHRYYPL